MSVCDELVPFATDAIRLGPIRHDGRSGRNHLPRREATTASCASQTPSGGFETSARHATEDGHRKMTTPIWRGNHRPATVAFVEYLYDWCPDRASSSRVPAIASPVSFILFASVKRRAPTTHSLTSPRTSAVFLHNGCLPRAWWHLPRRLFSARDQHARRAQGPAGRWTL